VATIRGVDQRAHSRIGPPHLIQNAHPVIRQLEPLHLGVCGRERPSQGLIESIHWAVAFADVGVRGAVHLQFDRGFRLGFLRQGGLLFNEHSPLDQIKWHLQLAQHGAHQHLKGGIRRLV